MKAPADAGGHDPRIVDSTRTEALDALPLVSVVIPVFQDPDGLQACLSGLLAQTMPSDRFEVLVVDNGSSPPTSIPDCNFRRLVVLRCTTPGSYAARNAGARAARGMHLAFTDADCVPDPNWLENGSRALEATGRDLIVGGEVRFIEPKMPTSVSLYQTITGFQQAENIAVKGFSATANIFCRRRVFERIGRFSERLFSGGDREWAWRAQQAGVETVFAPDVIVSTAPRTTIRGAVRQARRVAAGRYHLRRCGLAANRLESIRPHRGVLASVSWILTRPELGLLDRLRVLAVAIVIKVVSVVESARIRMGGPAERR